jgi:hypothetical protein
MVVVHSTRFNAALLALALFAAIVAGLALAYNLHTLSARVATHSRDAALPAPQISQAARVKTTKGLLRQIALHLSKMHGGESVGGFPGFEPPEDDERYKDKIRNQSYSGEEVNHWAKEINNLLRQIADKKPGLTLEEILHRAGRKPGEIKSFIDGLRNVHATVESWEGYGVTPETVETLNALMKVLGVAPW